MKLLVLYAAALRIGRKLELLCPVLDLSLGVPQMLNHHINSFHVFIQDFFIFQFVLDFIALLFDLFCCLEATASEH